jgi:hypothetical protein
MRLKWLVLVAIAVAVAATVPASGSADPSFQPRYGNGSIAGVVPSLNNANLSPNLGSGDLTWHGGPVMHSSTTYAIYWTPSGWSFPAGYQSTIDQFFADVAADSGTTGNVYGINTQYSDGAGKIAYSGTFAGSTVDTHAYPASGCSDPGTSICLTDAQLKSEIASVVTSKGWPKNATTQYFLFTPQGVGSCFSAGGDCAYSDYCAYHGEFYSGGEIIYANQPWTKVSGCTTNQFPNGSASGADSTISVVSHEHNEAITDPQLNAWYDAAGYENGDKCAWIFGAASGSYGSEYNQTINGHHYYIQEEWDNASHSCLQHPAGGGGGGGGAPTVSSLKPSAIGQGATKTKVTVTGTNFVSGATVSVSGSGVTVKSVTFDSSTQLTVKLAVTAGAAPGLRDLTVTEGSGSGTCTGCLTIDLGPTVTSILPAAGVRGASNLPVQIIGSNFANGAKVKFDRGITVSSQTVVSSSEIDAVISISATAATGGYDVTVTNKDDGASTLAKAFTVG